MRLPWVSRAAHDQALAISKAMSDVWLRNYDQERAENRRLSDIIVELRREGFQSPARPTDLQPVEPMLDDAVLQAIAGRAAGLPEVERELVRYAHSLRGMAPEEVAAKIWRGSDYDGEDD